MATRPQRWMAAAAGLDTGPKLQTACLPDDKVKLTWPSSSAKVIVQASPDLNAGSWSNLPDSEIGTEGNGA